MVRGKSGTVGVGGNIRNPVGARLPDDQAEQAAAARQRPDRLALMGRHAAGDEALDPVVGPDDPESGVAGADERPDTLDDQLEGILDIEQPGDCASRLVDGVERGRVEGIFALSLCRAAGGHVGEPTSVALVSGPPAPSNGPTGP